jgi:TolB-like protein
VVEENNLIQNISMLRRVLGASAGDHPFILTVPGHGYRLVEPVQIVVSPVDAPTSAESALTSSMDVAGAAVVPTATKPTRIRSSPGRAVMIAAGLVVLALVAAAGWFGSTRTVMPTPIPIPIPIPSLAILPFKALLPDSYYDVLPLGLADTLITQLSTNPHVVVRSLDSVRRLVGSGGRDAIAMGQALGVSSVLEGYIQRQGDRVQVNARLLAVPSGSALGTGPFDTRMGDVFAMQDAIT